MEVFESNSDVQSKTDISGSLQWINFSLQKIHYFSLQVHSVKGIDHPGSSLPIGVFQIFASGIHVCAMENLTG